MEAKHSSKISVNEVDDYRRRGQVFESIRSRLISGLYEPGERIKLRPLAMELGTSVTPVREALLQLVVAGALEHSPQRSIKVPKADWVTYMEIRELRISLEGRTAAHAAGRMTREAIETMEDLASKLENKYPDNIALHRENLVKFHFEMYRQANRPVALRLIETLWLRSGPYLNYIIPDYLPYSKGAQLRAEICAALRRKDAMAVMEAVETDLRTSLGYLIARLQGQSGGSCYG